MTESEARSWLAERFDQEKLERLDQYVSLLLEANRAQNLIGKASEASVWVRHILDSAQLIGFAPEAKNWLDIGSGAGLPGAVIAILTGRPLLMVEPRRKRAEFLNDVAERLNLSNVRIRQAMVERVSGEKFDAVTARAYTTLPQIFLSTIQLTHSSTIWVLPKGRSAERELAAADEAWQGVFHVEQSLTDDEARIVVATGVKPR